MSELLDATSGDDLAIEPDIDFLDRILQDVFGLGLKLHYCLSVLDEAPAHARRNIEEVLSGLSEIAEPIRGRIYRLGESRNLSQEDRQ